MPKSYRTQTCLIAALICCRLPQPCPPCFWRLGAVHWPRYPRIQFPPLHSGFSLLWPHIPLWVLANTERHQRNCQGCHVSPDKFISHCGGEWYVFWTLPVKVSRSKITNTLSHYNLPKFCTLPYVNQGICIFQFTQNGPPFGPCVSGPSNQIVWALLNSTFCNTKCRISAEWAQVNKLAWSDFMFLPSLSHTFSVYSHTFPQVFVCIN